MQAAACQDCLLAQPLSAISNKGTSATPQLNMAGPLKQVHVSPSGVQRCAGRVIELDESFTAVATTLGTNIYCDGRLRSVLSGHNRAIVGISYEYPYLVSIGSDDQLLVFHVPREAQVLNRSISNTPTSVALRPGSAQEGVLATVKNVSTFSLENSNSRVLWPSGGCCCIQWHPTQALVACGFTGSSGSFVRLTGTNATDESLAFNPSQVLPSSRADSLGDVTLIRWDPLGQTYFLAAYSAFGILLWDSASQQLLRAFPNISARSRASSAVWLPSAPGLFATAGVHSGVLTVWNVSQDSPVASQRVPGVNGVHDMVVKRSTNSTVATQAHTSAGASGDWSAREELLLAARDGGVVAFSCGQRTVTWQAPAGHTDTVFDAAFCPDDASILATCSFDSFVRLWSAEDYTCVDSFKVTAPGVAKVCLYALAWAPGGDGRLATADNNGNVFVVNTRSGAIRSFMGLHAASILRLAWSVQRPSWVASTSTNGVAQVWDPNTGEVVRKLTHMQPSHGVSWQEAPSGQAQPGAPPPKLLLGNSSGSILLWDVTSEQPPQVAKAHSSVVFNVAASPLSPHLVASASNDGNVAVWNTQDDTIILLRGHTDRVRALTWHRELVHVLISGSWDSTIRVWDASSGRCSGVCREHRSDVYAVATHPGRPDCFASVSRDSTLRWWKMNRPSAGLRSALLAAAGVHLLHGGGEEPLRTPHYLDSATQQVADLLQAKACPGFSSANQALSTSCTVPQLLRFALLRGGASEGGSTAQGPLLAGITSRHLAQLLRVNLSGAAFDPLALLGVLLSTFFASPGSQTLLDTLRAVAEPQDSTAASAKHASAMAKSILHPGRLQPVIPQALISRAALAAAAEMDVRSCSTHVRIGGPKRETALRAAASMYMRTGNIREYCDIQIELGDWEAALAAAPAVSMEYWQSVLKKRGRSLEHAPLTTQEPFLLLTGQKQEVTRQHTEQGSILLAAVLNSVPLSSELARFGVTQEASGAGRIAIDAATAGSPLQPIVAASKRAIGEEDGKEGQDALSDSTVGELFSIQASNATQAGRPVQAAAWHLSGGLQGTPRALHGLLQANETELAWLLSAAIPSQFSRDVAVAADTTVAQPRLVHGKLVWVASSFKPVALLQTLPAVEAARRMCLRCFRHGLWGAGMAVLRAAGFSAADISLHAAQIPLTAGLVALAGTMLGKAGLSTPASRWVDACGSAAVMSMGMSSDTVGALQQVPARSDEDSSGAAFVPYAPSLSQLLYGKPGSEVQVHPQLDDSQHAGPTGLSLATDALLGLSALYSSVGLQPRHQIANKSVYESQLARGDVAGCVKMLLRCGEFTLAAEAACVHLQRMWSAGAASWSGAVLAKLDQVCALLLAGTAQTDAKLCEPSAFWNLTLHPEAQRIIEISSLLRHVPAAVVPIPLKHRCALLAALFALFDSMSRGFTGVVTPLCRFVAAQDGVNTAILPLPSRLLRLVQGLYELNVAGDAQKCLVALQRYCVPSPAQDTSTLTTAGAAAGVEVKSLQTVFDHANDKACNLAETIVGTVKQIVALSSVDKSPAKPTTALGALPVSSTLPGTCTAVNGDTAFQQQGEHMTMADAAASSSAPLHFASAVSGLAVRRGATALEDGFLASEKEALEWALVCPFSPTGTGEWIVPF